MTADVDFDRSLASWLEAETTAVPDDALDRAMSRVGRTRQRPTWLVAEGISLPTARAAIAVPAWAIVLIALLLAAVVTIVGARLLADDVAPIVRPSPSLVAIAPSAGPTRSPASPSAAPSTPPGPTGGRPILAYTDDRSVIGPVQVVLIDAASGDRTVLGTLPGKQPGTHVPRYSFTRVGQDVVIVTAEAEQPPTTTVTDLTDAGRAFTFRPAADLLATCCPKDSFDQVWAISPDGTRITGIRVDERGVGPRPLDVLFVNLDGTNRVRSPFPKGVGAGLGLSPWAPDGSAIVAGGCRPCNPAQTPFEKQFKERGHLYIVPVDGSPWREFLDIDEGSADGSYSPDGSTILAGTWICARGSLMPRCDPAETSGSIVTIDVATGQVTKLRDEDALGVGLSWSPDGTRILYKSKRGSFVMRPDGSHEVAIDGHADTGIPQWSPDGRWILFEESASDFTVSLWVVPTDGSAPARRIASNVDGATW